MTKVLFGTCGSLSNIRWDLVLLAAPEFPTFLLGEAFFLASDEAFDPSASNVDREVANRSCLLEKLENLERKKKRLVDERSRVRRQKREGRLFYLKKLELWPFGHSRTDWIIPDTATNYRTGCPDERWQGVAKQLIKAVRGESRGIPAWVRRQLRRYLPWRRLPKVSLARDSIAMVLRFRLACGCGDENEEFWSNMMDTTQIPSSLQVKLPLPNPIPVPTRLAFQSTPEGYSLH